MARTRQGWRIRRRTQGGVWYVRFSCDGRLVERSTGTGDRDAAAREAARIYAHAIASEKPRVAQRARLADQSLEVDVAKWLISLKNTHDPGTVKTWEGYATAHFLPWFESLHNVSTLQNDGYLRHRLGSVLRSTVQHELTALRSFIAWGQAHGKIPKDVFVPPMPKRATGTAHTQKRRSAAIEVSPEEVEAILAALDKWSNSKKLKEQFPIRARFLVAYETGLRPSTLDRMRAPLNYRKGATTIRITSSIDKSRWVREVPITARARKALDEVTPETGLIFGKHEYKEHIRAAAKAVLPKDRAERFCAAHLRSAMITHSVEKPKTNLAGLQYRVGHKQLNTTARYMRPSLRAALLDVEPAKPAEESAQEKKSEKSTG